VSHLGELLSALVDGELSGAELDRANAHVAACGACRVEANALRRLKHELRGLADVDGSGDITRRLLAMNDSGGYPDPAGSLRARQLGREPGPQRRGRPAGVPYSASPQRLSGRRRGRYVLWSTLSLVVVGIGTAAFGMGGGSVSQGPQITPQLEVYDLQHAVTSGDVLYDDPSDVSTRVPVVAATP